MTVFCDSNGCFQVLVIINGYFENVARTDNVVLCLGDGREKEYNQQTEEYVLQ